MKRKSLIAYFSRFGNTDYPDDIDASTSASVVQDGDERYGTTEYIATIIKESVGGELHRIEVEEPYSEDFDEVTEKSHEEMEENYLPPLALEGQSWQDSIWVQGKRKRQGIHQDSLCGFPVWYP